MLELEIKILKRLIHLETEQVTVFINGLKMCFYLFLAKRGTYLIMSVCTSLKQQLRYYGMITITQLICEVTSRSYIST